MDPGTDSELFTSKRTATQLVKEAQTVRRPTSIKVSNTSSNGGICS